MLVSGTYTSKLGGEQYLTIGNFYTDDSTNAIQVSMSHSDMAFYYIDDVYIMDCDDTLGIKEIGNNNSISIYPNPVTDNITINAGDLRNEIYDLRIYDVIGNLVLEKNIANNKTSIDVSTFSSGVYVVEVRTENGIEVKKFLKE
jgi:hypothetical protein